LWGYWREGQREELGVKKLDSGYPSSDSLEPIKREITSREKEKGGTLRYKGISIGVHGKKNGKRGEDD